MRKKYLLRNSVILTAALLLGMSCIIGGVYAYYAEDLQVTAALEIGSMDLVFDPNAGVNIGITDKQTDTYRENANLYASHLDTYTEGKSAGFAIAGEIDEDTLQPADELLAMQMEACFTQDSVVDQVQQKSVDFTTEFVPANPQLQTKEGVGYYQIDQLDDRVRITIFLQLQSIIVETENEEARETSEEYTCTIPIAVEQYHGEEQSSLLPFSYAYFTELLEVTVKIPFAFADPEQVQDNHADKEDVSENNDEQAKITESNDQTIEPSESEDQASETSESNNQEAEALDHEAQADPTLEITPAVKELLEHDDAADGGLAK